MALNNPLASTDSTSGLFAKFSRGGLNEYVAALSACRHAFLDVDGNEVEPLEQTSLGRFVDYGLADIHAIDADGGPAFISCFHAISSFRAVRSFSIFATVFRT